jgi:transcriptional regulator with XRE-family HTH domain
MTPAEIKALRQELRCTARELGDALGLDQETVLAWEREDQFPTKRYVDRMAELRKAGPTAIPRRKRRGAVTPMQALADPELWRLLRKLLAHAELRDAALKLAAGYDDPADGSS